MVELFSKIEAMSYFLVIFANGLAHGTSLERLPSRVLPREHSPYSEGSWFYLSHAPEADVERLFPPFYPLTHRRRRGQWQKTSSQQLSQVRVPKKGQESPTLTGYTL